MALVGDIIITARAEMPDPVLQTISAPSTNMLTNAAANLAGGTIPSGTTIFYKITAVNPWGETLVSAESNQVVNSPNNAVTFVQNTTNPPPPGATAFRIYWSSTTGNENRWVQTDSLFNAVILGINGVNDCISGPTTNQAQNSVASTPPARSTAWLPDSDGDQVSAAQMFRWLNEALTEVAKEAGGIQDRTGLNTTTGNMYYTLLGRWLELSAYRWDQWGMQAAAQDDIFYRFNVTGVSQIIVQELRTQQTVIALWPIPNLSGSTTTLTAPMAVGDTTATVATNAGFTANQQFQIDSEIMAYAGPTTGSVGTSFVGLIRGIGGTVAAAHSNGATVTELKTTLYGFRYPTVFNQGDSLKAIDAPPAWELPLKLFIKGSYKGFEQLTDEEQALKQEARREALKLRTQRANAIKSKQLGPPLDHREYGFGRIILQ